MTDVEYRQVGLYVVGTIWIVCGAAGVAVSGHHSDAGSGIVFGIMAVLGVAMIFFLRAE